MKDFWVTFSFFTVLGTIVAAFVRFVFFLSAFGYTTKFIATVALFAAVGFILALVAQRYKVVTRVFSKIW